jgi:cyclic beta-1,2-glucan synthetase
MAAVAEHLVRKDTEQLLLFTPPFVNFEPNPGYIRAYPPGIRENGGQYTHGAIWSLMAWAQLGDGDRAKQLFDYFSPIHHTRDPAQVARYKLETYAVAATFMRRPRRPVEGLVVVYGPAGWLYRAGLESILGIRTAGDQLLIQPCIPRAWRRFDVDSHFGRTVYHITVTNPFGATNGISHAELDHLTILRHRIRIKMLDDQEENTINGVMAKACGL